MKRFFHIVAMFALLVSPSINVQAATLSPGTLIKASGPAVYYYSTDGKRYVFPNEKTYFTWYENFSGITTITDAELAAILIGGNVTYRPGIKMVKIMTDPKVYAVGALGALQWVTTEEIARTLYGNAWAGSVEDVPDAFFVDYEIGNPITDAATYDPDVMQETWSKISDLKQPIETPDPEEPEPEQPQETSSVSISVNKTEAQKGQIVYVSASTTYAGAVQKITLTANGLPVRECAQAITCSGEYGIPKIDTAAAYTFKAVMTPESGEAVSVETNVSVVSEQTLDSIQVIIAKSVMRQNQNTNITVRSGAEINADEIRIYIDDTSKKFCSGAPVECKYTGTIIGDIGSSHQVYAKIKTPGDQMYRSVVKTVTLAENDSPEVTVNIGKSAIYSTETVDITASASDDDGVATVRILQNDTVIKTCQGAAPCTVLVGPFNLPTGSTVSFDVSATDALGQTTTMEDAVDVQIL